MHHHVCLKRSRPVLAGLKTCRQRMYIAVTGTGDVCSVMDAALWFTWTAMEWTVPLKGNLGCVTSVLWVGIIGHIQHTSPYLCSHAATSSAASD